MGGIRTRLAARRGVIGHWAMEIAIVVLGILIAFALQGWAEDVAARRRAGLAQARIRAEAFDNAMIFVERLAVDPCVRNRLRYLAEGLTSGGPDWRADAMSSAGARVPVLPLVYRVPSRSTVVDSYRAAVAANDIVGIDPLQRMYLDQIFAASAELNELNRAEQVLAAELKPLAAVALPDAGDRAAMLGRLARLDDTNRLIVVMAEQYFDGMRAAGLRPDVGELGRIRTATDWSVLAPLGRRTYGGCWNVRAIDRFDARLR